MQKVISINLNGNVYELDEGGYDALREYLARAEHQLETNPDRSEIVADLEQAVADKCQQYLGPHKTVVVAAEVDRIIAEMGPVESGSHKNGDTAAKAEGGSARADSAQAPSPRRLYRVPAGSMIAGVCTGVAAFFRIDVTIVRIAFVVAALITKGAAVVAYLIAMFVIPEASTPEQASGSEPLNAKDVVDRVRQRSTEVGREWRRQWRRQHRHWRRWPTGAPLPPPPGMAALAPLVALAQVALFVVMVAMLVSLVNTGAILSWTLPPDLPVWAAALVLLIAYQIVVAPLRAAHRWSWYPASGAAAAPFAFWNAVAGLVGMAFVIWLASNHIPEISEFLRRLPDLFRDFASAVRDLASR